MRRPANGCGRRLTVALVVAAAALAAGEIPLLAAELCPHLYVEKDTWSETMLASRAAYLRWQQRHVGASGPEGKPFISDPIPGEGPAQHISIDVSGRHWMRLATVVEDGGGNCHVWGEAKLIASDGSETRLGSLKPVSAATGWGELLVDRNRQDQPLKIGSREFEHGIWVHGASDVCYRLEGKYERFDAWIGIDAARAHGSARFKVLLKEADLLVAWRAIHADFPTQSHWFAEDTGARWTVNDAGRYHLDWFARARDTRRERSATSRVLDHLGPRGESLKQQLDKLHQTKTPADDPRWLDLYVRTRRYHGCCASLDRIWVVDLKRTLESRLEELLNPRISPDNPQWGQLESLLDGISRKLAPGEPIDTATFRPSVEALQQAFADRFTGRDRLLAQLDKEQPRWDRVVSDAAKGDNGAIEQLSAVGKEIQGFRHALLLAVKGMSDFLVAPVNASMEAEWAQQYETLKRDLGNREHFARVGPEVFRQEAMIQETDRDPADVVLRRTAALLADLKQTPAASGLTGLAQEFAELYKADEAIAVQNSGARYVLFAEACRVRRQIAFSNPLLCFDKILFIKRHRALFSHMCDQYYGMTAMPGGGVYVLSDAFGQDPMVRDVLADSVVERGRLEGRRLSGKPTTPPKLRFDGVGNLDGENTRCGSFLSPDLSYDGKTILFAYVECRGEKLHRHHTDPTRGHWHEGRCYHLFKVNVDGTGLEQLTDGTWNDFDPCWLPNGRIAFVSERRGGYLRCGRVCPSYTLFDMTADGMDIRCLSFHETNEWQPSVTNDGLIVWTRWDYVDRFNAVAHMPWVTTPDGRDPRAVHGNFSPTKERPDMELDCRSIPGSQKLVATAAPHHGQTYGSLIIIEPRVPDDDGMAPVRRITPEVGFPESQGGAQIYGTPWPLSEDYYLCVYDAGMQQDMGRQFDQYTPGNYGIYLVDSFGNRELIYRDAEIACLSPIPLGARRLPNIVPELPKRRPATNPRSLASPDGKEPEGTVAVLDVYDSFKPWPAGTKIKGLRVLQVLPMSVPSGRGYYAHETGRRVVSAPHSVMPVRHVLGTVPVEEDGSAHFTVPACKEIFFQALNEEGLAVQSMRSGTYLQEGQRLVCAGCHEPKYCTARTPEIMPLALRREPSRLKPDVDGSHPFSYPRLVQPVLDRHCVKCHAEHPTEAPNLAREPIKQNWFASYNSLVHKYAFYDYGDTHRTTPGQFGAKASKLYELLSEGHHDVKLSDEELHRLTLWLDCTSMFYGVYEKEAGVAQLRGEIVRPTLE